MVVAEIYRLSACGWDIMFNGYVDYACNGAMIDIVSTGSLSAGGLCHFNTTPPTQVLLCKKTDPGSEMTSTHALQLFDVVQVRKTCIRRGNLLWRRRPTYLPTIPVVEPDIFELLAIFQFAIVRGCQ